MNQSKSYFLVVNEDFLVFMTTCHLSCFPRKKIQIQTLKYLSLVFSMKTNPTLAKFRNECLFFNPFHEN